MLNRHVDTRDKSKMLRPAAQSKANAVASVSRIPQATNAREKAIYGALSEALEKKGALAPLHIASDAPNQPPVADIALILCHYGQSPERIDANKRAIEWTLQSDPAPAQIIFVEAAAEGEPLHFEYLADLGVTYIARRVPKGSEGLWLKEPLWGIAAGIALQDPAIAKLCFLDADCAFADQAWAPQVSEALEALDIISPHSCAYYAGSEVDRVYGVFASAGYQIAKALKEGKSEAPYGHPGMAVAMTRGFYASLGRLPYVPVGSGDTYLWHLVAGRRLFPAQREQLAYPTPILGRVGMRPPPRIGCAGQVLCHHDHGAIGDTRIYQERWVAFRACFQHPLEGYAINADGIPDRVDSAPSRILAAAMPAIADLKRDKKTPWTRQAARDIYDKHALAEYGAIDEDRPLVVATLLRSGGRYEPRHVRWLRDQFEARCKTAHRFVCLSDVAIKGVDTIPLELPRDKSPGWWGQLEYLRPGLFPEGASVLCCDLDTVLYRDFELHRCPLGEFAMSREIDNWSRSSWAVWNAGLMYFSGAFGAVWWDYLCDLDDHAKVDPEYHFPGSQEYIVARLLAHDVCPVDIVRHVCYNFFEGDCRRLPSETQIACFPMTPKPWDIIPRPWCVPELPKE